MTREQTAASVDTSVQGADAPASTGSDRLLGYFRGSRDGATLFERYAGVIVLWALILGFSLARPSIFPTYQNFVGIAANPLVIPLALALTGCLIRSAT